MTTEDKADKSNVVLEVDGVKFLCERDELVRQSPYFEAMFSNYFVEKHKDVIKIQGVDAGAMKFLLHWMNETSQIDSLRGEEVLVVLQAAAMLQFERLQRTCEEVMVQRWLSTESCLLTAATADQLSLPKLYQKATAFALWNFCKVRHSQAFLDLPIDALVQYLMHDSLSLGTSEDEFQVFEGISCWLEHNIPERCSQTVRALSCVRMNFISISDIRSMLNYACVGHCRNAQLLLHCIICFKEDRKISRAEENACHLQDSSISSKSENNKGCCETFKRIADHIKSCSSESTTIEDSFKITEMNVDDTTDNGTTLVTETFSNETLMMAQSILNLKKRQLPTVACIIGHVMKVEKNTVSEENTLPSYDYAKKNKKEKIKSGTPYIFFWDSNRSERPIPLLPLSKIDQGPTEALGYTVVSRGQDLYVIGGEYLLGYGDWNKSVWQYNVWNETWTFETSLVDPRRHHFVVCLDDDMYVIGGCGRFRVIMDSVDRYNFVSKTWHKCASLPSSLYSAATCVHQNLIYVISCQVFCYYPTTNCWVTLSDINIPAGFNTAMPFGQHIYLTGLYLPNLMRFDPIVEKSITCVGSFQNPAGNACLVGDKIYSFTEHDEKPCVEMYDISNDTFKVLWKSSTNDGKISFKKLGGCFPLVLYETLWHNPKSP